MSHSWDQIRSQIRQFRTNLQSVYPMQVLAIIKDFVIYKDSLYFLSNNSNSTDVTPFRNLQLYQINLECMNHYSDNTTIEANTDREYLIRISNIPILKRQAVFMEYTAFTDTAQQRRFPLSGVSSFQIVSNVFVFTFQNSLYIGELGKIPQLIPSPSSSSTNTTLDTTEDSRLDPKLGHNGNLIAFVRNRDIWITDMHGHETQLTFCTSHSRDTTLKCGIAEYMMQEEFHRFTGFYWSPKTKTGIERILYLETSELNVEQVFISKSTQQGTDQKQQTPIRYPRAGKANATSELKLVEFRTDENGYAVDIVHKKLWGKNDLKTQFPWMEYIVRFGWLPDGQCVWLQIVSRDQKRTAVLKLNLSQFSAVSSSNSDLNQLETEILWKETADSWINVADIHYFLSTSCVDQIQMIWSSEKDSGYRHLYLVEKQRQQKKATITALTEGEWCCVDRPLYVDESRSRIYFSAKLHTPLETHFYVLDYKTRYSAPKLLTRLGFSHTVTMNSPDYFIDCFSTLHDPQVTMVQRLNHTNSRADRLGLLIPVALKRQVETPPSPPFSNSILSPSYLQPSTNYQDSVEPNGEIFSFNTSDGLKLYGCLYKPRCYKPGQSYPTMLHIYGGPKTQLVVNEFKFPRLVRYLMSVYFGFAVVVIDSRGSSDRGILFESYIQDRLGRVELGDQLEGLQYLHDSQLGALSAEEDGKKVPVIDLNRVAITGWSYGGYLSLMAIAQYSDRFKMAIAGAPVTQWELYDAAYTERYMGFPTDNAEAYQASNVLTYVEQFPDEEYRLLIAHGLLDENVHFRNTEMLVSQLVKYKKPHYLQVYPSEKHGLRHASVNEHFEILMFYWLVNYL